MLETIVLGITSFIGTNMDDLLVNMIFFSKIESERDRKKILLGKYLGIGFLIAVSMVAALGLQMFPKKYIPFLGIIPILLGIKEIMVSLKGGKNVETEEKDSAKALVFQITVITMANGADNIGVYIPLFAGFEIWQTIVVCVVFLIMTTFWYYISKKISEWKTIRRFIVKYKNVMIPVVYIALGIYIFLKGI